MDILNDTPITGDLFKIHKIKERKEGDYYLDIWMINSNFNQGVVKKL